MLNYKQTKEYFVEGRELYDVIPSHTNSPWAALCTPLSQRAQTLNND